MAQLFVSPVFGKPCLSSRASCMAVGAGVPAASAAKGKSAQVWRVGSSACQRWDVAMGAMETPGIQAGARDPSYKVVK